MCVLCKGICITWLDCQFRRIQTTNSNLPEPFKTQFGNKNNKIKNIIHKFMTFPNTQDLIDSIWLIWSEINSNFQKTILCYTIFYVYTTGIAINCTTLLSLISNYRISYKCGTRNTCKLYIHVNVSKQGLLQLQGEQTEKMSLTNVFPVADPGFPLGGHRARRGQLRGSYVSKILYVETKESGTLVACPAHAP